MTAAVRDCEKYVEKLFNEHLPEGYVFHNLNHTKEVAAACGEMAGLENLTGEETELLLIAAWFHDTGYIKTYTGHEDRSIEFASEYLKNINYPQKKAAVINDLIGATKLNATPVGKLEKILCDADMVHLGSIDYIKKSEMLRKEWEEILKLKFSDYEWYTTNISFFKEHKFYTEHSRQKYEVLKKSNLEKLQEKLNNIIEHQMNNALEEKPKEKGKEEKAENGKEKGKKKSKRGIETLFRLTSKNHIELSAIADNKANIMISINAIIISIVVSALMNQLQQMPVLLMPTIILLTVCLGTIIFATISTRPKVTSGKVSAGDIEKEKGNLLFFGNFHDMSIEEYEWGMKKVLESKDYLYGSLTRDIYYLGLVLQRKYKFLRISYNIFMYGLVAAVLSYIAAFLLSSY